MQRQYREKTVKPLSNTTQNYQFDRPIPNPYNLRGNPDEFDWGMNQEGDGLNGQPSHNITPYASFDGEGIDEGYYEDEFANHPGFISGFLKRNPDRIECGAEKFKSAYRGNAQKWQFKAQK